MNKRMMIDFRDEDGNFVRRVIDNFEFCIRDEQAYFVSDGKQLVVPMKNISQVYTY